MDLPNSIIKAIESVVSNKRAPLHEPHFFGNELTNLKQCIESTYVSSVGPYVDEFEEGLSKYTGSKHVLAVVNGTAALHLALKVLDVRSNDEVLVPTLTFVATANAVVYCGAIPHFIDCERTFLGVDAAKLRKHLLNKTEQKNNKCVNKETGRVISALIVMHTFGHPVDLNAVISVANEFNIRVVEDAAESLGSLYQNKHTGTLGDIGILSFNGNKIITTGGGGAILTNNSMLASRARHLSTTSKVPHNWEFTHDEVGYNYRMPNINAALGCAQLKNIEYLVSAKRNLFKKYTYAFNSLSGIKVLSEPPNCRSNYWLQTLILDNPSANILEKIITSGLKGNIMCRPAWRLMHSLPMYVNTPRMDLSAAEALSKSILNIPSSSILGF